MPEENEFPFGYVQHGEEPSKPAEPPKLTELLSMVEAKRQEAYDKHCERVQELREEGKLAGQDYDAIGYWDAYLGLSTMLNECQALVKGEVHIAEGGREVL